MAIRAGPLKSSQLFARKLRLVPVLEKFNPGDTEAIHVVYVGQGGHLPARMRVLIDFLAERVVLQTISAS